MEYIRLVTVIESLDILPIKGIFHQAVNVKIDMVIVMVRRTIKTTRDTFVHVFMILMILYYYTNNILFQTATVRLLLMILIWMILGRKHPFVKL